GETDKIRGYKTEGADEEAYDYDGRRMYPFGVRAVPPAGTDAIRIAVSGGPSKGVIIAGDSRRYGPSDLSDGEVAFYNKVKDCLIELLQTGDITIDTPSGQTVILQGGTHGIAREGDPVKVTIPASTFVVAVAAGAATLNASPVDVTGTITSA